MQARYEVLLKLAACAAAFVATSALTLALAALFDSAGRTPWLADTAEARAAVAACNARDERDARQRCLRQVVAAAQARDAGRTTLAHAAGPPK